MWTALGLSPSMKNTIPARKRVAVPPAVRPLLSRLGRLAEARHAAAYAVGGCVRDWLLRRPQPVDVDVAVEGDGLGLAQAAAKALRARMTAHEQFGTAALHLRAGATTRVDVATCRRETYARPAAYPKVVPGALEDDLFRRDFTINAMAVALAPGRFGALIDPFGGAEDLRGKRLRILHPQSFVDDPSRILRGIRFSARFGFRWEPATARALRAAMAAGALSWLNTGRLRRELDRMLEEPDPRACLRQLAELGAR